MAITQAFWDVDGVLNAVTGTYRVPEEGFSGWRGWKLIAVEQQPITYSEELIERINKIIKDPRLSSSWLTSWVDRATGAFAPAIGLEAAEWPVLGYAEMVSWAQREGAGTWWKLQVIREQMRQHRGSGVLWIDDEISSHAPARTWIRNRSVKTTLSVSPKQVQGLTRHQVEGVERFLKKR